MKGVLVVLGDIGKVFSGQIAFRRFAGMRSKNLVECCKA